MIVDEGKETPEQNIHMDEEMEDREMCTQPTKTEREIEKEGCRS